MHPDDLDYHAGQLTALTSSAKRRYHQLVLLTGGDWETRSAVLQRLAKEPGVNLLEVGDRLSAALLTEAEVRYPFTTRRSLETWIDEADASVVTLDHLEILFLPALQTDPLGLLKQVSRVKTIVASWPGSFSQGKLHYAQTGHPEHYEAAAADILLYQL